MIADRATLAAAAIRSQAAARAWRQADPYRAIAAALASGTDATALADQAAIVLADDALIAALVAPLVDHLRADPWYEPPFRVSRDGLRIGAVLVDTPAVAVSASITSADGLARIGPPATVIVPGRLTVVRYWRGGGVMLRRWSAGKVAADATLASLPPCAEIAPLYPQEGAVIRIDGREQAQLLANAQADVVTLTATIRVDPAPLMREYRIADGAAVRLAMLDDRGARGDMLLALLRHSGRADAGDCFADATHDAAYFRRWSAMREWLALDARAALPRLRAMASGDPHPEVRAAAIATLAAVDGQLAARTRSLCPA
jgi:hypothetical protein